MNATEEYEDARDYYKDAVITPYYHIETAAEDARSKYDSAATWSTLRTVAIVAVAGVYLANTLDAYLTSRGIPVELRSDSRNSGTGGDGFRQVIHATMRF